MTVNRTTLLDLPLPVTGTESGTWGDTTNNGLTQYMDIAVAGMTSLTSANFTAGALTLANTTGDSSATNIAAGSAQYGAIKVSSLATNSTITAPSSNRRYTIINADATYSVTIKASGQTGVTIVAGEKALVAFNGTDYVKIATANGTGEFTTVDTTNLEVTNIKAKDGTAAATIADSTGVVSITANPILSGGTANGVLYLNGSKVATSGSSLQFNGTNFYTTAQIIGGAGSANANIIASSTVTNGGAGFSQFLFGNASTDTRGYLSYSHAAEAILFGTSGTEQMRLTSTGLGIGTSSPAAKLDVLAGASRAALFRTNQAYAGFELQDSGSSTNPGIFSSGNSFTVWTGGSERMRLDSSGNLGLGVTPVWGNGVSLQGTSWSLSQLLGFDQSGFYTNARQTAYGNYVTNWVYRGTAGAAGYAQTAGGHFWLLAPSGTAGNAITFTQAMTLDTSGNLGLGVTPSAWGATYKAAQFGTGGSVNGRTNTENQVALSANAFHNGTAWTYIASTTATQYQQAAGTHYWFNAPSGTAGNAITFTQAMTLDASGNLGVGQTSPLCRLDVRESNRANSTNIANVGVYTTNSPAIDLGGSIALGGRFDSGSQNEAPFASIRGAKENSTNNNYAGYLAFQTIENGNVLTERARITSDGDLLIGTTGTQISGGSRLRVTTSLGPTIDAKSTVVNNAVLDAWNNAASGDNIFVRFWTEGTATQRGSIDYNRGAGLTAYNTTSDYRAKDILGPVTDSGATIDALKVYEGKMKGATQSRPMLVAHEAQALAPYAVTGEKDAVDDDGNPKYQQMDVSSFVPLLIAEIQSLRQRVAQLEGTQP
jgi:hypothetical protein